MTDEIRVIRFNLEQTDMVCITKRHFDDLAHYNSKAAIAASPANITVNHKHTKQYKPYYKPDPGSIVQPD